MLHLGHQFPRFLVGCGRVNNGGMSTVLAMEFPTPTCRTSYTAPSKNGLISVDRQSIIMKGHHLYSTIPNSHTITNAIITTNKMTAQPQVSTFPPSRRWNHFTTTRKSDDDSMRVPPNTGTSSGFWKTLLQDSLPHVEFSTNPYELERHGRGESYHPTRRPDLIASPTNLDDVVTIMKFCVQHKIPLVPFGVGTSVEGHVCCLEGGISLDMKLFQTMKLPNLGTSGGEDDVGDVNFDLIATVGAGVTRMTLNNALRHTGLQFVVDPGADATLGGMVATGASGTTAVRYGTMRENILQLECVIPDLEEGGIVVNTGTQALKNSAGYDLTSLFCGSEGTLGVITSVTVKLHPIPDHVVAATCVFDTLKQAALAVNAMKLCEIPLVRCELLDTTSITAFNAYQRNGQDSNNSSMIMEEKPTLFLEFHGPTAATLQEQVHMTESICTDEDHGGSNFTFTSGDEERKALWSARHSLYYASLALRPGAKDALLTDACVPLSKFANLIEATAQDVQELGVVGPCFGHAGDGNFHCILPVLEDDSEDYTQRLHQVNNNLIQRTLEAGGTCTGEHGVGYGKIKYLERQFGMGAVTMMKRIKSSLDPHNIMNPGKVVLR